MVVNIFFWTLLVLPAVVWVPLCLTRLKYDNRYYRFAEVYYNDGKVNLSRYMFELVTSYI